MTTLKEALRNVEKARSARADAAATFAKHCANERAARASDRGVYSSPHDPTFARLQKAADDARTALRLAEADLSAFAGGHIAGLAADRVKLFRAALKAIGDLEAAHKGEAHLQAVHGWCKMPCLIGEMPFPIVALRVRLEAALSELEPAKISGRAA